ncbi:FtsX-like permease family protein [Stenomitos frigidus]|uniref:ABC transporter permease n=1 Tax=Stenomitos frigidus ULC18 TaxID=2107698 RepID=A0A2T1EAN8_9CYAN|nr:FtsX-like permease family protein [Stenomitos frigidus]PSB29784.1 ABC transporter permease [Stenomitos frigidus ULC18]
MASIARKNLFEDIPRFLVAQAGIMFAVSLVTIQIGILNGFTRSTGLLIDQSSADIWVASEDMVHLEVTSPLPLDHMVKARKVEGVQRAEALMIRAALWRSADRRIAPIRLYGFDPKGQLFANWKVAQGELNALSTPYTMVIDKAQLSAIDLKQVGDSGSIGSLPAKLVGLVQDTQSMASSAAVFTSLETANAFSTSGLSSTANIRIQNGEVQVLNNVDAAPARSPSDAPPPAPRKLSLSDSITFILIQAKPGQDLPTLRKRLEAALPGTRTLTRAEMAQQTRDYWEKRTGVGFILGLGAAVGFVVGMVVVSQILYSSVADHIKEYGTLKAMGASDWIIYRVITEQALWMAVLGYLPSMVLCIGLGSWTMAAKGIMILISPMTATGVFCITVVMCVSSAMFAIQKVTKVDPAIVFKA